MRRTAQLGCAALLALALTSTASASLVNGGFETGDLTGWTVALTPNGQTAVQTVDMFDIDGPGPIATSYAAKFCVGKAVSSGAPGGIELTQTVFLEAGTAYRLHFDYAAANVDTNPTHYSIDPCGTFDLIVNGISQAHGEIGELLNGESAYGALSANYTPATSGDFVLGARITRPYRPPVYGGQPVLFQYVDNFYVPEPGALGLIGLAALWLRRR